MNLADVQARRLELGLTIAGAARTAGVSRGTWYEIEQGVRKVIQPLTQHKVETAMQWPLGSLNPPHLTTRRTPTHPNGDLTQILERLEAIETDIRLLKRALR